MLSFIKVIIIIKVKINTNKEIVKSIIFKKRASLKKKNNVKINIKIKNKEINEAIKNFKLITFKKKKRAILKKKILKLKIILRYITFLEDYRQ